MKVFLRISWLVASFLLTSVGWAQSVQYRKINIAEEIAISIPDHWDFKNEARRKDIAAAADALYDPDGSKMEPMHVSSLSASNTRDAPQAIVRVSFIEETGTQESEKKRIMLDRTAAINDLSTAWAAQVQSLKNSLLKQGAQYLGDEQFSYETIDGKIARVYSYRRSSRLGGTPFRVSIYQVPLGQKSMLLTISVQESHSSLYGPILDRVKNSLRFK